MCLAEVCLSVALAFFASIVVEGITTIVVEGITTCGRSTGCLTCGALFAAVAPFWSLVSGSRRRVKVMNLFWACQVVGPGGLGSPDVFMSPFLCAAYAPGAACVAGCRGPPATLLHCLLALSSPLTGSLLCQCRWSTMKLPSPLQTRWAMESPACAYCPVRLVLLSSPISPFIHFCTPSHGPRLPTPFSPHFFLALPHTSRPGLSTAPFYHYDYNFTSLLPLSLTLSHLPPANAASFA